MANVDLPEENFLPSQSVVKVPVKSFFLLLNKYYINKYWLIKSSHWSSRNWLPCSSVWLNPTDTSNQIFALLTLHIGWWVNDVIPGLDWSMARLRCNYRHAPYGTSVGIKRSELFLLVVFFSSLLSSYCTATGVNCMYHLLDWNLILPAGRSSLARCTTVSKVDYSHIIGHRRVNALTELYRPFWSRNGEVVVGQLLKILP